MLFYTTNMRITKYFYFLVFVGLCFLLVMIYQVDFHNLWRRNQEKQEALSEILDIGDNTKVILMYTPEFGRLPWSGLETPFNFSHYRGTKCPISNCLLTYNKQYLSRSDAVVFQGSDVPDISTMEALSVGRNQKQRWVFYTHENPHNIGLKVADYNYFFNWTITYRRDSEIFWPYGNYEPIQTKQNHIRSINYAEGKDMLVAWVVSHCGVQRDKVVAKLLQYTKVSIFGRCGKQFNGQNLPCVAGSLECDQLLKRFKFYLAFENAMCIDYVTEKYWETPFRHNNVPIVFGSNYDARVAIPGSYINVLDFPSIKALADYLKYLDQNDTAYNEYFNWRTKYRIVEPIPLTCRMCEELHNKENPLKIYNLENFWGTETTCGKNEKKLSLLLHSNGNELYLNWLRLVITCSFIFTLI